MSEPVPVSAGERYGACEDAAEEYGMNGMPPKSAERDLPIIEAEILFYKRQAGASIIEIGKRLNEAKAQLSHGEWLPWLREKVDISERSATNFMRIAREYPESVNIADLGTCKALALLDLPDSERERFAAEKHVVNGVEKGISEMTGKELKQAIRERDAALRAAEEAKAAVEAAAENQAKMEADMKLMKELQQRAKEAEEAKTAEIRRLESELAAIKSQPVEVAVEVKDASPEQLAQARAEAAKEAHASMKQALQAELDAKESQLKKAREELKSAREESKAANINLRQAEKEAREAKAAAEKAQKMAQVNSNQNMVRFTVLFNQVQETVNLMADAVEKETPENQKKMRAAMKALSAAVGKAAE